MDNEQGNRRGNEIINGSEDGDDDDGTRSAMGAG
jgi:hypothetical protein